MPDAAPTPESTPGQTPPAGDLAPSQPEEARARRAPAAGRPLDLVTDLDTAALWFSSRMHARLRALSAVVSWPLPPAKPPVAACGYRRHGAADLKPLRPHPMKRRHLR